MARAASSGRTSAEASRRRAQRCGFTPAGGRWRPYGGSGLGAYLVHLHDHFRTRDASGAEIPGLQFDQTTTEVKPGAHLVVGLERAGLLGGAGLGVQARWDGILAGGIGSVLSAGVVVTLD